MLQAALEATESGLKTVHLPNVLCINTVWSIACLSPKPEVPETADKLGQ